MFKFFSLRQGDVDEEGSGVWMIKQGDDYSIFSAQVIWEKPQVFHACGT
ncbi:hypothetical protein [Hahella sp. HN01]|nr:hypothetical protein [Hahella sp. HN01]MBU6950187.1 hypothetical protein [Hahella sp. HN01]